jgi:hypothetical protein
MRRFKAGDKVRKKNGETFSNDQYVVTIERDYDAYGNDHSYWLKETQTHIDDNSLELAFQADPRVEELEKHLDDVKKQHEKEMEATRTFFEEMVKDHEERVEEMTARWEREVDIRLREEARANRLENRNEELKFILRRTFDNLI